MLRNSQNLAHRFNANVLRGVRALGGSGRGRRWSRRWRPATHRTVQRAGGQMSWQLLPADVWLDKKRHTISVQFHFHIHFRAIYLNVDSLKIKNNSHGCKKNLGDEFNRSFLLTNSISIKNFIKIVLSKNSIPYFQSWKRRTSRNGRETACNDSFRPGALQQSHQWRLNTEKKLAYRFQNICSKAVTGQKIYRIVKIFDIANNAQYVIHLISGKTRTLKDRREGEPSQT